MSSTQEAYSLLFDGGKSNKSISYGYIIKDPNGNIISSYGEKKEFVSGSTVDNNHAEFLALIMGITACIKMKIKNLNVFGDSAHVIEIMNKQKNFRGMYTKFSKLILDFMFMEHFDNITFSWVPRKDNIEADRMGR